MTPEERYFHIREQSCVFSNKNMLRHHLIMHLKEAAQEQKDKDASIAEAMGFPGVALVIKAGIGIRAIESRKE